MNRNLFWKFIFFVILPIGLSALFIIPPTSRELVVEFNRKAIKRDADFRHILERVQALQKARPDRQHAFDVLTRAQDSDSLPTFVQLLDDKSFRPGLAAYRRDG